MVASIHEILIRFNYWSREDVKVYMFKTVSLSCFRQVLEVIAAARHEDISQLAETIYQNTETVFSKWSAEITWITIPFFFKRIKNLGQMVAQNINIQGNTYVGFCALPFTWSLPNCLMTKIKIFDFSPKYFCRSAPNISSAAPAETKERKSGANDYQEIVKLKTLPRFFFS